MTQTIDTAILGASGYTGAELLRLLENHPQFHVRALTGDSQAGKPIASVYPHLRHRNLPDLVKHTDVNFSTIDVVFCCLPHGTTQEIIAGLPSHVKIVDLSADFRLHSLPEYAQWYGHAHRAPELQKTAVYGLTEHTREAIAAATLVANPGCYPTASLLPLLPLLEHRMVRAESIVIDALSGVSGAGRSAKQEMLFCEVDGGVSAYGIGAHRHMAEMEQEISRVMGEAITISFTPHLMPMPRGMLATIHVPLADGVTVDAVRTHLRNSYEGEAFVHVLEAGAPSTHQVRGTNHCVISAHAGRIKGELILVSVIDNLVKGASGQALQNANLMFGLEETTGLSATAVFP
jgi:N-acetyl-gamma-glutamyl-phosphate reductase